MNVILINGSPNAKGCTYTALEEVAKTLEAEGIETEIIHVGNKNIRGCIGCRKCKTDGKCVFNDIVNEVSDKFAKCDGIVIGSPVYYASANGTLISFLDRLFYSLDADKTMRVGAAVVSARRAGTTATFDELNKYFTKDEEGLQIMRVLGKNMAFLIKSIQLGKEKYGLPKKEQHVFTPFIR